MNPGNGRSDYRRLGLLAPFAELPGDLIDAALASGVLAYQVVTTAVDSHEVDDLANMGEHDVLLDGGRRLQRWRPEIVMWACTSGSFVVGRGGSLAQSDHLARELGVPVSSTSLAFIEALRALDVDRVDLLSPYPLPATEAFISYLAEWDVEVAWSVHLDHPGARSSERTRATDVQRYLERPGRTDFLLLPDTAVWGFELLLSLGDASTGILTANQVTLWQALRMLDAPTDVDVMGTLRGL